MSRTTRFSFLTLGLLPAACSSGQASSSNAPAVVTDTLGFKFSVDCSRSLCLADLKATHCLRLGGTTARANTPRLAN